MSSHEADTPLPPATESVREFVYFQRSSDITSPANDSVEVVFRRQPRPVEARHRLAYRTSLLVLTLSFFNQNAARLDNLHVMTWATRSSRTRRMLLAWWSGRQFVGTSSVRMDPDLDLTLRLARADGLIEQAGASGQRLKLTDLGLRLADLIRGDVDVLVAEKEFLMRFGRLSDAVIDRQLGRDRP